MTSPCGPRKLPRSFYERPTLRVAKDLLGKCLVHRTAEGEASGVIVEAEAYMGINDPASHAYKGRRTPRNEVMWGPAGHAYIYPIYGMYLCLNIVTVGPGVPEGVFIRALQPADGLELMARRRGLSLKDRRTVRRLTTGPSKLCIALGITRDMNGMDVTGDELFLTEAAFEVGDIGVGPRIGIDYAGEGRFYPWRFVIRGNPFISKRLQTSGEEAAHKDLPKHGAESK